MRVASFASFAASATTTTKPSTATRIHIGSCSDTEEFQPMWSTLRRRRGDAFFWGGDIVYGDRFSPEVERLPATYRAAQELLGALRPTPANASMLQALYGKQKRESGYAAYAASLAVVDGIWDDHDFGVDNAHGGTLDGATKDAHKAALLDFLDVAPDDARRAPGAASSPRGASATSTSCSSAAATTARSGGALLGQAQWAWLEDHLAAARPWATATVIVSPTQVLASADRPRPAEGWFEYPAERQRLFEALARHNATAFLVSGDVHFAELSAYACEGGGRRRAVAELTTSGLSHAWGSRDPAFYDSRALHRFKHFAMVVHQFILRRFVWTYQLPGGRYHLGLNAGELDVDAEAGTLVARALDHRGRVALERTWALEELHVGALGAGPLACAPVRGAASRPAAALGFAATYAVVAAPVVLYLALTLALAYRVLRCVWATLSPDRLSRARRLSDLVFLV
ncbi:PhoD-like phosphatase [Aureococcus anophagefferens]|nr:PhoD-like phosphatase [Aureococcus anophagefferens]